MDMRHMDDPNIVQEIMPHYIHGWMKCVIKPLVPYGFFDIMVASWKPYTVQESIIKLNGYFLWWKR